MEAAKRIQNTSLTAKRGRVVRVDGSLIYGQLPNACVGDQCEIIGPDGATLMGEVSVVESEQVTVVPYGSPLGIGSGHFLSAMDFKLRAMPVGPGLLGRTVDAFATPLDGGPSLALTETAPVATRPINPMQRAPIKRRFDTGITAIDCFTTLGMGQKTGLFGGSGVGKTNLLIQIARFSQASVNIIGLVGERGREVRHFIDAMKAANALDKTIFVVAPVDESPVVRVRAAHYATAIAEYFRSKGENVLLALDSLTRVAMAQREIGLATGEPPTTGGYTPSVFSLLSRIVERTGLMPDPQGSITSIYSVLVEGDDFSDPVVDSCRSILDGGIVLSRDLAQRGHYPAIEILQSNSRLQKEVLDSDQLRLVAEARSRFADYHHARELAELGVTAGDSMNDVISTGERLTAVLKQADDLSVMFEESLVRIGRIVEV